MQDTGITVDNVAEQLASKGRTEAEVVQREGKQKWALGVKFMEEDWCDYIIKNSHDPTTKRWKKGKEELLAEFHALLAEFRTIEQKREDCLRLIVPEGIDLNGVRRDYLKEKWELDSPNGFDWIYKQIKGRNLTNQELRNLSIEFRLQRMIDLVRMSTIRNEIHAAVNEASKKTPENAEKLVSSLNEKYKARWAEIENDTDGLDERVYQDLVNMLPLFEGETIKERIKLLRSAYRDQESHLYKEEQETLRRRFVKIFDPDHFLV